MKIKQFTIVFWIILCVFSITLGFSAFGSELSISDIATNVRIAKDVRITNVELINEQSSDFVPNDLDFDIDSVVANVTFNNISSYVTYKITVTNIGNIDACIYDIILSNQKLNYEIIEGNFGDRINSLGNNYNIIVKVSPAADTLDQTSQIKLDFDIRSFYSIEYENLTGSKEEVIEGEKIETYIGSYENEVINVYMNNLLLNKNEYTYNNGIITIANVTGDVFIKGPHTFVTLMKSEANLDTNTNFSTTPDTGVYIRNGTENDTHPIYYYRGAITNNNVIFANFCWKVVRTTETGGTKLIYNGVPAEDGSCNNTGTDSQIGTSAYNEIGEGASPAHAGYMYGVPYVSKHQYSSSITGTIIYGNDITWDGTNYTLKDTVTSSTYSNDYETLATKYHYTCLNDTGICSEVYYIHSFSLDSIYYLTMKEGKNLDIVRTEMFSNTNDSTIKKVVDSWYSSNLTNYTDKLEDTIWCNDRTIYRGSLKSKDDNATGDNRYTARVRNTITYKPSLSCEDQNDRFTVNAENGNKALTYPIGLLTADELTLAGSGRTGHSETSFLHTGEFWRIMTPYLFSNNNVSMFAKHEESRMTYYPASYIYGVRPAISLKEGIYIYSGEGSTTTPYIIK